MATVQTLLPLVKRLCVNHHWVRYQGRPPQHRRTPLTSEVLAHHLNGGPACGACPITPGHSTTRVGLFDLDAHGSPDWPLMVAMARKIMTACELLDLSPVPFRSTGGNGIHIYLLWDSEQDAYSVRQVMASVLHSVGLKPGTTGVAAGTVEIFPKQDAVDATGSGSMFLLPGSGRSTALDVETLGEMEGIEWPTSHPVPWQTRLMRPVQEAPVVVDTELSVLLDNIPNAEGEELGYDDWLRAIAAVHHASGGSDEGLMLAHGFSAKSSKYDPADLERRWASFKLDHGQSRQVATVQTLKNLATRYGWQEDISDDFPVAVKQDTTPLPAFDRTPKGRIKPTVNNLIMGLKRPDWTAMRLAYDAFRDAPMWAPNGTEDWRMVTDSDVVKLRQVLEVRGYDLVPRELMRDCLRSVATDNTFDSAQKWLTELKWDGIKRVESFFGRYMAVHDTLYTRAVARYLWTALAARVMQPGCQVDMVPVLVGSGGLKKTSMVMAISPSLEFYGKVTLNMPDTEFARRIRGKLVAEVEELRGIGTRDSQSIKAMITRREEEWTPKYLEYNTKFKRRVVLVGTTDNMVFLQDESNNNRRWLPVKITRCAPDLLKADCDQLWAEALVLWKKHGLMFREAESLAIDEHAEFMVEDILLPRILSWLHADNEATGTLNGEHPFHVSELMQGIGLDPRSAIPKRDEQRFAQILRSLGYRQTKPRIDGRQVRCWVYDKPDNPWD